MSKFWITVNSKDSILKAKQMQLDYQGRANIRVWEWINLPSVNKRSRKHLLLDFI